MNEVSVALLYHSLSGRVIGELIGQLLFFGVFALCLVMTRRAILDSGWATSQDFLRYVALTVSIALFTLYIGLTYEIENYKGAPVSADGVARLGPELRNLSQQSRDLGKALLVFLLPVDMIGIALNSSMFAIVTICINNQTGWTGRDATATRAAFLLLGVLSIWHMTMIAWWCMYGYFENGWQGVAGRRADVLFHAAYIAVELLAFMLVRAMARSTSFKRTGAVAWSAVLFVCVVLLSLYFFRLWDYSDRFFEIVGRDGT